MYDRRHFLKLAFALPGGGDPRVKVARFLERVRKVF